MREVGRGGMGRVFLAEQEDESFRRRVALKLLDRPALTERRVRRFRDEVRILASLEHPGIARFLDGGRTNDGVWFLALEYVEGVDLLEHARNADLAIEERVRLFLAVLDAVAAAHAQGVVHRDLKPGNILVGADGRPRLLDFGISKLIDAGRGRRAEPTTTQTRAFTPAYASPEQFRGEGVTAASDVYSLGVVLYELLCGVRPFSSDSRTPSELERAVLEREPEPPSAAARRTTGSSPKTGPPTGAPRPRLGRDLDAICLKALRKLPHERYPSVVALATDLERWLDGRPVEALRGDRRYRAAKLLRRHRGRITVAVALAVAAGALVLALRPAPRPAPVASAAVTAPRKFPIPPVGTVPLEELERRFAAEPASLEAGAALATALVRDEREQEAAVVVGRLRQIPGRAEDPLVDYVDSIVAIKLDEPQRALTLTTRALDSALATGRGELVARIRITRARVLSDLGRREDAHAELVVASREATASGDDDTLGRALNDLAIEELAQGRLVEGEKLLERALAASRRAGDVTRTVSALHNLAGVASLRGNLELAASRYRETAAMSGRRNDARRQALSLLELSLTLDELGRPEEARSVGDEALAMLAQGTDDTSLAEARAARVAAEIQAGRLDSVDAEVRAIEGGARASGNLMGLGLAERLRGAAASARGKLAEARARFASARRIFTEYGDSDPVAQVALDAAEIELEAGDTEAAAALANAAAAPFRVADDTDVSFHAATLLARVDARAGRLDEAARRLDALGGDAERRQSVRLRVRYRAARAELARRRGDTATARRELEAAIAEAMPAGRTLDALRLSLDSAELAREAGELAHAARTAGEVRAEADRLGLSGLAERARELVRVDGR